MPERAESDDVYQYYVLQMLVYYACLSVMLPLLVLQIVQETRGSLNWFVSSLPLHTASVIDCSSLHGVIAALTGPAFPDRLRVVLPPVPALCFLRAFSDLSSARTGSGGARAVVWVVYWLRRLALVQCVWLMVWNADMVARSTPSSRPALFPLCLLTVAFSDGRIGCVFSGRLSPDRQLLCGAGVCNAVALGLR
jgi:hypothetical protein